MSTSISLVHKVWVSLFLFLSFIIIPFFNNNIPIVLKKDREIGLFSVFLFSI